MLEALNLEPINPWCAVGVLAFVAIALYTDLKWRRIPNEITVPALIIALVVQWIVAGTSGLLTGLGGFAVGFGILFLLWLIGGGGGGDVKLMGAAGAWVGPIPILAIFIGSAIFAIVCTAVLMARQPGATAGASTAGGSGSATGGRNALKASVPYAVPMGMATLCVVILFLAIE